MAIPAWHAGTEEAPLSPHKAVAIASQYVETQLGVHGSDILWIQMLRLGKDDDNRWAYDIYFSKDPPLISEDPMLRVAVAMDGKLIVPEKRPPRQIK